MKKTPNKKITEPKKQQKRIVSVKHVYLGKVTFEEAMANLIISHSQEKDLTLKR